MKKRNFITGFSAAFVAAIALVSCGGIRAKDGVVLTINGKEYSAEDLFKEQTSAASAEAKFNAVYKVAVRRYFEQGQEGNSYMDEITRDTKLKVAGAKEEAKSNASKNGTKYDVEWKKILSNNSVDDETGLYDKFEYDLEKTKFEDVIYSRRFTNAQTVETKEYHNNYDVLRSGGELRNKDGKSPWNEEAGEKPDKIDGYIKTKVPYHMKHILVKVSAKDKDNTNGEITAAEAEKLYKVIKGLASGRSFDSVSYDYSDDTSAKESYGSLGIMSKDTNFVNDFKLGTYMYESYFGTKDDTARANVRAGLNLVETAGKRAAGDYAKLVSQFNDPTTNTNSGIGQIPYGEVLKLAPQKLGGVGDLDLSDQTSAIYQKFKTAGVNPSDVKAKYYPRNVIFNKYFNKHNIMVITPTDVTGVDNVDTFIETTGTSKEGSKRKVQKDICNVSYNQTEYVDKLPGFNREGSAKNDDKIAEGKLPQETGEEGSKTQRNVLRDDNGRVIFVFRSGSGSASNNSNDDKGYQGIHFVVIERSPFIASEYDDFMDPNAGTPQADKDKYSTTLEEYYTEYFPKQNTSNYHPKYKYTDTYKYTFTNYITNAEATKQKTRADTVKKELMKADDNLNTYVYNYLFKRGELKFTSTASGKKIEESINNWIKYTKREATKEETEKKWNETWETYYYSLAAQAEQREEIETSDTVRSKLIPEVCVTAFQGDSLGTQGLTLKNLFGQGGVFHE